MDALWMDLYGWICLDALQDSTERTNQLPLLRGMNLIYIYIYQDRTSFLWASHKT